MLDISDTITALASPAGSAARSSIRVSGPQTLEIVRRAVQLDQDDVINKSIPRVYSGCVEMDSTSPVLPIEVFLWPTNRSYTGQPMAELHLVGSAPLTDSLLRHVCSLGARPANRGEFTLRAFLSGRLDLFQAEAVLGVIDSTDDAELLQALSQLSGGISGPLNKLQEELLNDLADLEAGLDFVEEDIDFVHRQDFITRLQDGLKLTRHLLDQAETRSTPATKTKIVIAGLPNAGKSTLFNALCGSDKAIVSSTVGTTRDYVSANLNWDGHLIELIDTAGWEDHEDNIMRAAQRLRLEQLENADMICWCSACDFTDEENLLNAELLAGFRTTNHRFVQVRTKSDLVNGKGMQPNSDLVPLSAIQNRGLGELQERFLKQVCGQEAERSGLLATTSARCKTSLAGTMRALQAAIEVAETAGGDELIAMELRDALRNLGEMTGVVYTDDILDRIFSKFCIGK